MFIFFLHIVQQQFRSCELGALVPLQKCTLGMADHNYDGSFDLGLIRLTVSFLTAELCECLCDD